MNYWQIKPNLLSFSNCCHVQTSLDLRKITHVDILYIQYNCAPMHKELSRTSTATRSSSPHTFINTYYYYHIIAGTKSSCKLQLTVYSGQLRCGYDTMQMQRSRQPACYIAFYMTGIARGIAYCIVIPKTTKEQTGLFTRLYLFSSVYWCGASSLSHED